MSTLIKYNLLLLITLISMPAEYIWAFFKLHDLIHVLAKNVFVIIQNLYTGSHFQMPTKDILQRIEAGLCSLDSSVYRLCCSIKHQT